MDVVAAYTLKSDGRKLPVDPAAIRDPAPDPSDPLSRFIDRREKLIPFAGVAAGDSIVVDLRDRVFRPLLPGVFSIGLLFDRTQAWDDVRISVTVPGSLKLLADSTGIDTTSVGDGAIVTYAWRYRDTDVLRDDPGLLAPIERLPRLLITTATDWQQIGRAYAAIAAPSAVVTPLVRQTADSAAAGIADRRAVAKSLYDWVRRNIRYAYVPLGDSRLTPHAADDVLTNRIGDSQDEAVLLAALLSAEGIASDPVLIDLDTLYRLSIPVPFVQLNHVVLYLPEFSVYADPTVGVARFGELPFAEYGKPVVHAVAAGEVLGSTPILAPGAATETLTTTEDITADDRIAGDSRTEATGPFAVALRLAARRFAAAGLDVAGAGQLHLLGERGTGRVRSCRRRTGATPPISISSHFAVDAWSHISADQSSLAAGWPAGVTTPGRSADRTAGDAEPVRERTDAMFRRPAGFDGNAGCRAKVSGDATAARPDDRERRFHLTARTGRWMGRRSRCGASSSRGSRNRCVPGTADASGGGAARDPSGLCRTCWAGEIKDLSRESGRGRDAQRRG